MVLELLFNRTASSHVACTVALSALYLIRASPEAGRCTIRASKQLTLFIPNFALKSALLGSITLRVDALQLQACIILRKA